MRKETVTAATSEDALELCPWACEVYEVESGTDEKVWLCFECGSEAETWNNQE